MKPFFIKWDGKGTARFEHGRAYVNSEGEFEMFTSEEELVGVAPELDAWMKSAEYEQSLQNVRDNATLDGYQFSLYNAPIYSQGEVNSWQVTQDHYYLERLFMTWDAVIAASITEVLVDNITDTSTGDTVQWALNGYCNPQSARGATELSYFMNPNADQLWQLEFAAAVCASCDRILRSPLASTPDTDAARAYIERMALYIEAHITSWGAVGAGLNDYVERMTINDDTQTGASVFWTDIPMLMGTAMAFIKYWYTQWSVAIPAWLTDDGQGVGRPNAPLGDFEYWHENLSGVTQGQQSPVYPSYTKVQSLYIEPAGNVMFDPVVQERMTDVYHHSRCLQFTFACVTCGSLTGDALTAANALLAAYEQNEAMFLVKSTSCWAVTHRIDGTDDLPVPTGANLPVLHWAALGIGRPQLRKRWTGLDESIDPPCSLSGYTTINRGNLKSWTALAELGPPRADVYQNWQ